MTINSKKKKHLVTENKSDTKNDSSFFNKYGISLSATVIALMSLIFTIWQSSKIREFTKLSVIPKLQIHSYNYENEAFQIKIKNSGIGPAIIDDIYFNSNTGTRYSIRKLSTKFWLSLFEKERIGDSLIFKNLRYDIPAQGDYLAANVEVELLDILPKGLSNEDFIKAIMVFLNSKLFIEYHSIYNANFKDSLNITELKIVSFVK